MNVEELKKVLGTEFSFIFDKINPILQYLDISRNAKILDIGTGKGRMAIILAFNGYKVLTGEPESDNSEYAKQNWLDDAKKVQLDNLITFKAFNAEKMPFEDNLFDAIFIQGALHHIDDKGSTFNECIRTIKKDGVICILEPSRNGIKIIRRHNPSHPDAVDPRDFSGESPVEIKKGDMFDAFIYRHVKIEH